MSPTWKAAIGVIIVFIIGWIGGAATTAVIARHKAASLAQAGPEVLAIALERRTTHGLGLTQDQKDRVHAVFLDYIKQRQDLQRTLQPQVKAVNHQTLAQLNAILTPDQQQHFHENLIVFKEQYGRNPFNVGSENKTSSTSNADTVGASTPLTNAPSEAK